ncbi:MAG: ABC transporter substrate-binding protein, partial [Bacteroidota bacterium]|nr:ABC transporter substrate-binding protein [Bacteroidota bacterium]
EWEGRFERHSVPFLKTDYIGLLMDSASCASLGLSPIDARVRRAMSLALDRRLLVQELRAGGASVARGFVPHGMPGFTADERPVHPHLRHDPEAARALLVEVGIGTEPPLTRRSVGTLGTKPATAELAAALQHAWSEYGLDLDIDVAPSGIDAERVARSEVPLFRKSWLADYPDAENFLGLFDSVRWTPGGPNYTRHADQRVDSLLRAASLLPTGEERMALLREAEGLVLDAMPVIPLWHDDVLHLVSTAWSGWRVTPNNRLDLRQVERRPEVRP